MKQNERNPGANGLNGFSTTFSVFVCFLAKLVVWRRTAYTQIIINRKWQKQWQNVVVGDHITANMNDNDNDSFQQMK